MKVTEIMALVDEHAVSAVSAARGSVSARLQGKELRERIERAVTELAAECLREETLLERRQREHREAARRELAYWLAQGPTERQGC